MTLESMTLDPTTLLATYARNPASGIGEIVSIYSALAAASSARGVPRNDEDDEEEEDDDKKHGDDEEEDDDGEGYSE
jgi:ribosomal protein L12E/L44/L45/RPP1/RPP2